MSAKQLPSEQAGQLSPPIKLTGDKADCTKKQQSLGETLNRVAPGSNVDQNYFAAFNQLTRPIASGYPLGLYPYNATAHGNSTLGHCFYDTPYATTYSYDER